MKKRGDKKVVIAHCFFEKKNKITFHLLAVAGNKKGWKRSSFHIVFLKKQTK
jgi:hypothetical protein